MAVTDIVYQNEIIIINIKPFDLFSLSVTVLTAVIFTELKAWLTISFKPTYSSNSCRYRKKLVKFTFSTYHNHKMLDISKIYLKPYVNKRKLASVVKP